MTLVNKLWRRAREVSDQASVGISRLRASSIGVPFDGEPRVALLSVSFNTHELTKLMLLTLAERAWAPRLQRVVIADNRSSDDSPQFLKALGDSGAILFVTNPGATSHGVGLRFAIEQLEAFESKLPPGERSNVWLVADTDIIFERDDTLDLVKAELRRDHAALVGEMQFDLGEPYAHPCCFWLRSDAYHDERVWPFVDHGAPALWLQRSLRGAGWKVLDFPARSENHIVHRGRGTIAGINQLALRHAYAHVQDAAHFHGNPDGKLLWQQAEARHSSRLGSTNDAAAVAFIAAGLAGRRDA